MVTTAALATGRRNRTRLMDTRDSHSHNPMMFQPVARLRGSVRVPGDKSISHRALLLSAWAQGSTRIEGLGTGQDVGATAAALRAFGVAIELQGSTAQVQGLPPARWLSPREAVDCGNSGTTLRLLAGMLAGMPGLRAVLTGDASLVRRPMRRVVQPLTAMGAHLALQPLGTAPLSIAGTRLHGASHDLPVASAQVKTALLLAGLCADGQTIVREPLASRDHTERLLSYAGVAIERTGLAVRIQGRGPQACPLPPLQDLSIPGDPSSAAFLLVAALLHPDAAVRVQGVCVNSLRLGWLHALAAMGGQLSLHDETDSCGEPIATVEARSSVLQALDLPAQAVPACVDEIPLLALAAAAATGISRLHGLAELRVKESDRLAATARMLGLLGVVWQIEGDTLIVHGRGSAQAWNRPTEALDAGQDHRMAMAMAVAGLCGSQPTLVLGMHAVASSFPEFQATIARLST